MLLPCKVLCLILKPCIMSNFFQERVFHASHLLHSALSLCKHEISVLMGEKFVQELERFLEDLDMEATALICISRVKYEPSKSVKVERFGEYKK